MFGHSGRWQDPSFGEEKNDLHAACESGSLDDVIRCLGAESEIEWYFDGQTPLHVTVMSGRSDASDVIQTLLNHGADINAQTTGDQNTALHQVVVYGTFPRDFDLVMLFRENAIDLALRNKALRTPYDCAIASGQYELAGAIDGSKTPDQAREFYKRMLGERYGPYIIEAVLESDEAKLQKNIDLGGNPNMLNKHGAAASHYAVTHCKLPVYETLSQLLQAGADSNLRDEEGDTALNLVVKNQRLRETGEMTRCVQLLVDAGAHSDFRDIDGKDALQLAEEKDYSDVISILRKKECTLSDPSPQPPSPEPVPEPVPEPELEPEPVRDEEPEQVTATPREDVNQPNNDGLYPIHVATMLENEVRRHTRITTLLDQGATVSVRTQGTGDTSLHLCAERDFGETAKLLLDHHIDYTTKNNDGKTAYDIATERSHQSVIDAIKSKQEAVQANWQRAGKKAKFCTIL